MMKDTLNIALLCHSTVGGSGILATELGHRLADLGHRIFVISERPPFRLDRDHPRIQFCESTPVEFPLFNSPDHTLPLATRIAEVCEHHEIDLIHAHYAIPHAAAAWIAKELIAAKAPPVVTTLHGTDIVYLGAMPEYRPLLQHVLEACDKLTCVSEDLKQRALSLFQLNREIAVIPNFYEPQPLARDRETMRALLRVGNEPLAIHVSNLRSIKRIDLMLHAFQQATQSVDAKLLILAGADTAGIETEIGNRDLNERVIIRTDVRDVDDYYNAADLTLYSSEYESFCLGILEGMCHGLPSVSFDVGGIPEVVEHDTTGLLVPYGDAEALGRAIRTLAGDHARRRAMGAEARDRAQRQFSPSMVVDAYLQIYAEVLTAHATANNDREPDTK